MAPDEHDLVLVVGDGPAVTIAGRRPGVDRLLRGRRSGRMAPTMTQGPTK
jgi:hypothetical protein